MRRRLKPVTQNSNAGTSDDQADVLTLAYGDSATIRKTNVGRRRRVNAEVQGYLIDKPKPASELALVATGTLEHDFAAGS